MLSRYDKLRKFKSAMMSGIAVLCALLVVLPLFLVFFHLLKMGFSSLNWDLFTKLPAPEGESGGGMANAIVGTLELMGLALVMGVPIGLLGGIYLSEYGSGKVNGWIRFGADVLNGVPSIVWGLIGYTFVVVPMGGYSAFSGGLALAFIMIPLVLRTTEEVLVLVPNSYREAGMALGIPRWKITFNIVLRSATKGITTGILLALGRVAGETAPVLFTAFGNSQWNHSLKEPIAALPLLVYNYATSPYPDQNRQAWAGALVLILLVFLLSASVRMISSRRRK
ncbi:MAG TPA: phosphate ABC transporter permease PstA [Opitutales bacterium]|jgi:phosphate transport system permease protein|nr:phosphate ABC transporter permease PstA [Opitutales bacterium]